MEFIQSSPTSLGQKSSLFAIISDGESFVVTGRRNASSRQSKQNHWIQRPYVSTRTSCGQLGMTYGEQKKDTNRHWQLSLGTVIIHLHMLISYGAQAARKLVSFQVLLLNSITKRVKKFRHKRKIVQGNGSTKEKMVRFPYASMVILLILTTEQRGSLSRRRHR